MKELREKAGDGNSLASADCPALLDPILLQRTELQLHLKMLPTKTATDGVPATLPQAKLVA